MDIENEKHQFIDYQETFPSGNLKVKGLLFEKIKEGEWTEFFEKGNIRRIVNYSKGKKNGKCFVFKEDGEIDFVLDYKNGSLILSPKIKKIVQLKGLGNF